MRKSIFSVEQTDFLLKNYEGISTEKLTELFNDTFKVAFTVQQIANFKSRRKLKSGYSRSNWIPSHKPIGTETLVADGYIKVKIAEPDQWEHKHRLVWEQTNGQIPENHSVIFLDGNQQNCVLENLALVDANTHGYMFKNGYYTTDRGLTESGIAVSKLERKIRELEAGE